MELHARDRVMRFLVWFCEWLSPLYMSFYQRDKLRPSKEKSALRSYFLLKLLHIYRKPVSYTTISPSESAPRELSVVLKHLPWCSHVVERSPSVAMAHDLPSFKKSSSFPLHDSICRLWHISYIFKNSLQQSNCPESCLVSSNNNSCH